MGSSEIDVIGNNPFRITPDARFFHRGRAAMASHDSLLEGVEERHGVMLLVGEPGTGKTTLLLNLQLELESAGCLVVFPRRPMLSFDELIQACCAAAGLPEEDVEGTDKVRTFTDLLVRQVDEGGTTAIFIDDAHTVSDEFLVDLSRLTKIEKSGKKLLQVVLSGQLELVDRLTASNLPFVQECAIAYRSLEPLGKSEVGDYIKYRLARVGHKDPGFTAKAIKRIGHLSNGVPQVINQLCGMCLQMAEFENASSVGLAQVNAVAEDLLDDLVAPTPAAESKAHPESAGEEDELEEATVEAAEPRETVEPSLTAQQASEFEDAELEAETSDDKGAWLERAFADEVLGPEGLVELEAARQDAARLRQASAAEEARKEDELDLAAPEFETAELDTADRDKIDIDWDSLEAGIADRGGHIDSVDEPPSNVLHLRVDPPLRTPDRDDQPTEPMSPRAAVSATPRRLSVAAMFLFGLLFGGMTVGATWIAGGQGIGPLAWLATEDRPTTSADAKPEVAPDEPVAAVEATPVESEPAAEPAPVLTAEANGQQPKANGVEPGDSTAEDASVQPANQVSSAGSLGESETAQESAGTLASPPKAEAAKVAAIPVPKPPIPKPALASLEQPVSSERAIASAGQGDSLAANKGQTDSDSSEPAVAVVRPATPTALAAVEPEPDKPVAAPGLQSQGVKASTGATRTGAPQNGADIGKPANAPTSLLPSQAIISRFENGGGVQTATAPELPVPGVALDSGVAPDSGVASPSGVSGAEPSRAAPASVPTSLVGLDRVVTIEAAPARPQVQIAEGLESDTSTTGALSTGAGSPAPVDLGRPTQLLPERLQQSEQIALAAPTLPQREPAQPDTVGRTIAPAPSTEAVTAPASLLPQTPPNGDVERAPVGGLLAAAPVDSLTDDEEYRLQFASLASRLDAERERDRLVERHWDLLGDYDLRIAKGDVEGRSFYRIRSSPLGDGEMAYDTCNELGSRGQGCMVLRGDTVIRSIDPLPGSNGEPTYGTDVKVAGALGATAAVEGVATASSAAFAPQGDMAVLDFLLTRNVEDREPVDRAAGFAAADREGYAYARIKNDGSPTKVAFLWRRGEQLVSRYRTTIGTSGRWRTWSSTELWPGSWSVAIVKEGGEVLAETNFVVE